MHIVYTPEDANYWLASYENGMKSHPQYQVGGDLAGFRAFAPHHRGGGLGSFFRSLFRYVLPILKTVGKEALITGSNIATDVSQGKSFAESAQAQGRVAASNIL